jgi:RND family efflux transporter MFP subunit
VINSTRPILVSLSVPQRFLDEVRLAWSAGDIKVTISPNPISPAVAEGSLVFIDNAVNQQTGTIVLKARVKNEKEQLWPGQFVAARIVLRMEENALVLPESAVQPGQETSFVYVAKEGRAHLQKVEVDRQVDDLVVISKGLSGGEAIIREVPPVLADGSAITVRGAEGSKGDGKGGKGSKAAVNGPDKESSGPKAPGKGASRQEARS